MTIIWLFVFFFSGVLGQMGKEEKHSFPVFLNTSARKKIRTVTLVIIMVRRSVGKTTKLEFGAEQKVQKWEECADLVDHCRSQKSCNILVSIFKSSV